MPRRIGLLGAVLAMTTSAVSGCTSLPFTEGTGNDSYQIQVELDDAANLVTNSEVKINDLTVGTVTELKRSDWHAVATVSLPRRVRLSDRTRARIGQKSLLGAMYLELTDPAAGKKATNQLSDGGVIDLKHSGAYPATEDVLIALSNLLNGSGLTQVKTITTELNRALDGNTGTLRSLLRNLAAASKELASQRKDIATLIDRLATLTKVMTAEAPRVDKNLGALGPGLAELNRQRPRLMEALSSIDRLRAAMVPLLRATQKDLATELNELKPVLAGVADAGNDLPDSLNLAGTVLFPLDAITQIFKGDYGNLFLQVDIRLAAVFASFGDGTPPVRGAGSTQALLSPTYGTEVNRSSAPTPAANRKATR